MAHELFARIADILSAPSETQALIMHETLVIACHEGLKIPDMVSVTCRRRWSHYVDNII